MESVMLNEPVPKSPAIVIVTPHLTIVPAQVVAEVLAWLDEKERQEREEIEALADQMEAAEREEDPGRFPFDPML